MFGFLKLSVSPTTFSDKLWGFYLANSFKLVEQFMEGLAGTYSEEQLKAIRGEMASLVALAHEFAVHQYIKPKFRETVLEFLNVHLADPSLNVYRHADDMGVTFMKQCGFERNAYIHDVGVTVFRTTKDLVKSFIKQVRIEEGGI